MAAAVGIKGQLAVCGVYKDCFEGERVIKQKLRVCKRRGGGLQREMGSVCSELQRLGPLKKNMGVLLEKMGILDQVDRALQKMKDRNIPVWIMIRLGHKRYRSNTPSHKPLMRAARVG